MIARYVREVALVVLSGVAACNLIVPLDELGSGESEAGIGGQAPAGGAGGEATGGAGDPGGSGAGDTGGQGGTGNVSTGSAYADAVLSDGPIAYWRLDERPDAREVEDASGNGHQGVVQGGVVFGAEGAFGVSTAASFDGASAINFGDKFDFAADAQFSVEFWMSTPLPDEGFGYLGKAHYTDEDSHTGWFVADGAGVIQAIRGAGIVVTPVILPDTYTHFVMTYDGLFLKLYLNGSLANEQASTALVPDHPNPFLIGQAYQWNQFLGLIDEVALYDEALSEERVAAHFAAASR